MKDSEYVYLVCDQTLEYIIFCAVIFYLIYVLFNKDNGLNKHK